MGCQKSVISVQDEIILDNHNKIYYKLLIDIRNYKVLSEDEISYLNTISKYNLIEIINIYNLHMININEEFT